MRTAGWQHRREVAQELKQQEQMLRDAQGVRLSLATTTPASANAATAEPVAAPPMNPFDRRPAVSG